MQFGRRYRRRVIPQVKGFFENPSTVPGQQRPVLGKLNEYFSSGTFFGTIQTFRWPEMPHSISNEQTWDEIHPLFFHKNRVDGLPSHLTGGPFANLKVVFPSSMAQGSGVHSNSDNRKRYEGRFLLTPSAVAPTHSTLFNAESQSAAATFFPSLSVYHNEAWDKLRPKIAKAGFTQFLYELRDFPGMIRTTANGFQNIWTSIGGRSNRPYLWPKEAADHFLNHNFGWVPFVNDLLKFIETAQKSTHHMERLISQNGKWHRRKVVLVETETSSLVKRDYSSMTFPSSGNLSQICQTLSIDGNLCTGISDTRSIEKLRVWAEGSFRYYRPELDPNHDSFPGELGKAKRLLLLYGARINPAVIYRVMPWTWLLDWFTGIGRNISILNDAYEDQVAARYAYIMSHKIVRTMQTCTLFFQSGHYRLNWDRSYESKCRESAGSPYGFSLPWSGLSPKQLAILGALGISRVHWG